MAHTQQPCYLYTHQQCMLRPPHRKTINEISSIEPHSTYQPNDIENDQREAIEVFINRMNELDQQNYEEYAFIQEVSQQHRSFDHQCSTPQMKQQMLREDSPNNSPVLNRTIDEGNQFHILVGKKGRQIQFQLSALQIQKFQIIDELITFKQQFLSSVRNQAEEWEQLVKKYGEEKIIIRQQYQQNLHQLQQELNSYKYKYELLLQQKQEEKHDNHHLAMHIQELEELNTKLHKQLQHIEAENMEFKQQLDQHAEADTFIKQLQEQVRLLNCTLDQNSEYIFDLQQRVATESLQLAERETAIRKEMELQLQLDRQEIEKQYKAEFMKIRDQLQQEIRNQMRDDYQDHNGMKQQHEKQMADLQTQHQEQNQQILLQNQQLRQKLEEYQLQLKQVEKRLSSSTNTQSQLAKKVDNLHLRLKEKEVQLNYYKQRLEQLELAKSHPNKNNNILLIDELNNSNSFAKQSAVLPCSAGTTHLPNQVASSRDDMINNILSRIRMKQNYSILSSINDNNLSIESVQFKKGYTNSVIKPVSPQSMILQKQKDLRMKNISYKLQQLRSDIRREIGLISN